MIGFVIWIVGLILTFRAAIEIWNINAAVEKRLIAIVLIVLTSWLGLLFYYFYGGMVEVVFAYQSFLGIQLFTSS